MTDLRFSNQEYEACEVCNDNILLVAEGTWVMQGRVICDECINDERLQKEYARGAAGRAAEAALGRPRAQTCGCGIVHAVAYDAPDNTPCYACHMQSEYERYGGKANYDFEVRDGGLEPWQL